MRIALFLCFALAASAQERQEEPIETKNPRTSAADIEAGKRTFRSHCAPCHGYNGEGGIGPNLAAGRFYHGATDADLYKNISNGIPGTEMPGIFYNGERVWQLVAFVRSLHPVEERPAGDPARGAALFDSSGCARCHRVNGVGGSLGPDLSEVGGSRSVAYLRESITAPDASVAPRYWVASFDDSSGEKVRGFVMNQDTWTIQVLDMNSRLRSYPKSSIYGLTIDKHSAMPSYKDQLSTEQLNDLVAYLWSLRPKPVKAEQAK